MHWCLVYHVRIFISPNSAILFIYITRLIKMCLIREDSLKHQHYLPAASPLNLGKFFAIHDLLALVLMPSALYRSGDASLKESHKKGLKSEQSDELIIPGDCENHSQYKYYLQNVLHDDATTYHISNAFRRLRIFSPPCGMFGM